MPLLKCVMPSEADYIMREIYEGICGNHVEGQSLAFKTLRQGYYQPTMKVDCMEFAKKCDKCQRFVPISKAHPEELTIMMSPWPFAVQGTDLIGQLPKGRCGAQYAVVAVDYFTKWVEAKALASITSMKIKEFVYRNIVCRYGVPHTILSDNGKQFDCSQFKAFCDNLQIKKVFSLVARPQVNGQVEEINKTIKHNLKTKLEDLKEKWVDELPEVLCIGLTEPLQELQPRRPCSRFCMVMKQWSRWRLG